MNAAFSSASAGRVRPCHGLVSHPKAAGIVLPGSYRSLGLSAGGGWAAQDPHLTKPLPSVPLAASGAASLNLVTACLYAACKWALLAVLELGEALAFELPALRRFFPPNFLIVVLAMPPLRLAKRAATCAFSLQVASMRSLI